MRFLVIVVALSGCATKSDSDELDELIAAADVCWQYNGCENGGQSGASSKPLVPIEEGVECMTDALASGITARATWGYDDFLAWTNHETHVFTIDHEVRVFVTSTQAEDPIQVRELHGCTGPITVGAQFCSATDHSSPYGVVPVDGMAWTGCSEY